MAPVSKDRAASRAIQVVLYARVSSKDQEKEGFSIPAQLRLLRDYAAGKGFAIAHEFTDVETAKQSGRTNFGQMLTYLKKHQRVCRTILVEKTDRLYRNIKDYGTVDELDVEIHADTSSLKGTRPCCGLRPKQVLMPLPCGVVESLAERLRRLARSCSRLK
jgi:hypothetical protein